ncbi:Type 1 glutamine amidotransferase-like domain-containing protein [Candidatus Corynebacterium faecigallinarum]|uniref:Type 1 glutamine amidotransferase-like domain-containing protein n=1 Tax=Corynebacterium TaxID=1716 RepID=UPI003F934733
MTTDRSIVLLGGGFSEDEYREVDEYLLGTVQVPTPKVCFIPTASGDSAGYVDRFYEGVSRYDCELTHLELFRRDATDPSEVVGASDIIYVGGGNTANMLSVWRLHSLDTLLVEAYRRGTVLAGISAGAACWFEACLTDSFGPLAPLNDGLGLLTGSFCHRGRAAGGLPGMHQQGRSSCRDRPGRWRCRQVHKRTTDGCLHRR